MISQISTVISRCGDEDWDEIPILEIGLSFLWIVSPRIGCFRGKSSSELHLESSSLNTSSMKPNHKSHTNKVTSETQLMLFFLVDFDPEIL